MASSMPAEHFQQNAWSILRLVLLVCSLTRPDCGLFASEEDNPAAESRDAKNSSMLALDILALNEKSTGITLPDFDKQGRPSGQITAASATRTAADILSLEKMQILIRDDAGHITIDLPEATFNLSTAMLVGIRDVVIQRHDFILTGDRLELNTKTRDSVLLGNIKMRIYNRKAIQKQETPSDGE